MREIAGHDPRRYAETLRVPVGEGLKAYEHRLRENAREDYRAAVLTWAVLAAAGATKQKKPPEPPTILRD